MKIKVLRRYANKTALAARKDTFINKSKLSPKKNYGNEFKKLIADKVDKIKNDVQLILKSLYQDLMINRVKKEEEKE